MLPLDRGSLERLTAVSPDWVVARRREGFSRFEELQMPTSTEEVWRYVDLDFDMEDFGLASDPGDPGSVDGTVEEALGAVAGQAVIVDGTPAAVADRSGNGTIFEGLGSAIQGGADGLQGVYGTGVDPGLDKFSAAHHAFGGDGVYLYVPDGSAVPLPFHVEIQAVTPGAASFPRVTVVVEAGAEASMVLHARSDDDARYLVVPQIEVRVGENARFRLTTLQEWGSDTRAVAQLKMTAAADASVHLGEIGLGGILARLHLTIDLAGRGASGTVSGLYFGHRQQVLDYRAFVRHAAPHTTSKMFLKGAVEDEADSVFTGLIRVEKEAQKTDAHQTNRNLVLSEGAGAQSVPNLEILANDVRCGHGSAVGPLDLDQRYYLMSRGLDRVRADRLQVRGFFEEAISRLPASSLAAPVRERVNAKYIAAQEEGRV